MFSSSSKPVLVAMDLEGCLVPEIWIEVSKRTKIQELSLTTRDIKDYDVLMQKRIQILREKDLKLSDIQAVISEISPLEGAMEFLNWIRNLATFVILSDTFYQFAGPLMQKLSMPALFCHNLIVKEDRIEGYTLRVSNAKSKAVEAFQNLGFEVYAIGDSYNDIGMLQKANFPFLLHAPVTITKEFPQIPAHANYKSLIEALKK